MRNYKKWLFFPALFIGVAVLIVAIKSRPELPAKPGVSHATLVHVIELTKQPIAPVVTGFGNVKPKFEWRSIAEVSGKVVFRHPDLEKGQLLSAGTEIIRIDPLDYQLKLAQAQADVNLQLTALAKLNQEQVNLNSTLDIEISSLELAEKELDRKQNLKSRGLTSQSDVDQQQKSTLIQKKLVQDLQNKLALIPEEKELANARLKISEAKLSEAKRALDKTKIVLPKTMRISQVMVELDQVIGAQQTMVVAHETDVMEVEAQLSIHDLQTVLSTDSDWAFSRATLPTEKLAQFPATIQLTSGSVNASWPAKITRISESIDINQATAGVILEVEQDYQIIDPQKQPPLVNGMFVSAQIEGLLQDHYVIPEGALHGQNIYLFDENEQLSIRPVDVLFRQNELAVISGTFINKAKLVTNDVLPAIDGMPLRTQESVATKQEVQP